MVISLGKHFGQAARSAGAADERRTQVGGAARGSRGPHWRSGTGPSGELFRAVLGQWSRSTGAPGLVPECGCRPEGRRTGLPAVTPMPVPSTAGKRQAERVSGPLGGCPAHRWISAAASRSQPDSAAPRRITVAARPPMGQGPSRASPARCPWTVPALAPPLPPSWRRTGESLPTSPAQLHRLPLRHHPGTSGTLGTPRPRASRPRAAGSRPCASWSTCIGTVWYFYLWYMWVGPPRRRGGAASVGMPGPTGGHRAEVS